MGVSSTAVQGDITEQAVDVIVNAANSSPRSLRRRPSASGKHLSRYARVLAEVRFVLFSGYALASFKAALADGA